MRDGLQAAPAVFTLMLGCFSVGVGAGSLLCARLLRGEVSARLVPFAALGLSVFLFDFGLAARYAPALATVSAVLGSPAGWRMLADLLLLAACGGLYSVPLYALIQQRSPDGAQARMVAANNVVNAAAMATGAVAAAGLALLGAAPAHRPAGLRRAEPAGRRLDRPHPAAGHPARGVPLVLHPGSTAWT